MMKRTIPVLLMATALGCGTDVDLPLDLERGADDPPEEAADSPPDSPPETSPPLGALAWSRTDFGDGQGYVHDVAWSTDGGLFATVPMSRENGDDLEQSRRLTRNDADGTLDWEVEFGGDNFVGMLSPTEAGGVVVAVIPEWSFEPPNGPAGLHWYDVDGNLTATWTPGAHDTPDMLREINVVQALPDGGVFWAGMTLNDDFSVWTSVAGRLDAEGQLLWVVEVPSPNDDDQNSQPTRAALTADGDVILLSSYLPAPTGGEDDLTYYSSFVIRFAADGTETWRQTFLGDGQGNGIKVAPSGNLVVAGNVESSMTIGDRTLETNDDPYSNSHHHFVAELDPAGEPLGLSELEVPAPIDSDEIGVIPNTMTMIGDNLVVGGMYYTFSSDSEQLNGYYAATNSLDGALVSEMVFPVEVSEPLGGFGPVAADVTSDGRLALGGSFGGRVDFGDGEVDSGEDEYGFALSKPFIAVFDPPADCGDDVD